MFIWDLNSIEIVIAGDKSNIAFGRVVIDALARGGQAGVLIGYGNSRNNQGSGRAAESVTT